MAGLFNSIRIRPPKSNRFNLSHDVKLSTDFGRLTPIMCVPTLPGDVFKLNTEVLCRFAPMKAPIMHRINIYTHFFFVPSRLLWDHWKEFITGGETGTETYSYPRITVDKTLNSLNLFKSGSLADYLGFPVVDSNKEILDGRSMDIDALPFRAYQLIYNEYYRDQNLTEEVDIQKSIDGVTSGVRSSKLLILRNRSWRKDYFTSALPFAQRGDEVRLPLNGTAELQFGNDYGAAVPLSKLDSILELNGNQLAREGNMITNQYGQIVHEQFDGGNPKYVQIGSNLGEPYAKLHPDHIAELLPHVDLSSASAATINELRRAIRAQEFLEVAARGGSRYIEQIYSYFGVRSSDARLQRPEFLGGGKSPVMINDVLQTSESTPNSPLATPSGHAVGVQNSHSFKYRCEEHGYIMGIMSVVPTSAYQQGLPRVFQKFDRLDYYWPQFAHLGEQEIKQSEIYVDLSKNNGADSNETFGYTPRYAEYKNIPDSVHGDFRDSLSFWHMGRIFSNPPRLNDLFLTNYSSTVRPFAVEDTTVDKIWVNIHHNFKALRKMPKYGTPLF